MKTKVLELLAALQGALYGLQLNPGTPTDRQRNRSIANCDRLIQLIVVNRLRDNVNKLETTTKQLNAVTQMLIEDRDKIQKSSENMTRVAQVFTVLSTVLLFR